MTRIDANRIHDNQDIFQEAGIDLAIFAQYNHIMSHEPFGMLTGILCRCSKIRTPQHKWQGNS